MLNITTKIYSKEPGIYYIKNKITDYVYVGSTGNLYSRLINHRSLLVSKKHSNIYLQQSFNKHGIYNFEVGILEYCIKDSKLLYQREKYYCQQYKKIYNLHTIEEISFGYKRLKPIEERLHHSAKLKGKIPKNFKDMQKIRWKKVAKIKDGKLEFIFDSCAEAARSLNIKTNTFHEYIGKNRKSKFFPKNIRYEYYKD